MKGTVFYTLYKPTLNKNQTEYGTSNLYKKRELQKIATSIPVLSDVAVESYIKIKQRSVHIMIDNLGGYVDGRYSLEIVY